jgi:hypothetical protein
MNVDEAIKKLFRSRLEWGIEPDARVVDESVDVLASEPSQLAAQRGGNEFFAEVATDAETGMLAALGRRNIADSLAELLRLDAIRMKRPTITANAAE